MASVTTPENAPGARSKNPPAISAPNPLPPLLPLLPTWLGLQSEDGSLTVMAQMAAAAPLPSDGGGWQAVSRPKRRALTIWQAPDAAPMLTVAMVFDGSATGASIETQCRVLEEMAGAFSGTTPAEPPRLIVSGSAIPHHLSSVVNRWVIGSPISWDEDPPSIRRTSDGHRTRQAVTVELWLYTTPDELERIQPRKKAPSKGGYKVKAGDTYNSIAARKLGTQRLGRKLAQLNGDRDPSVKLRAGREIKLPSKREEDTWRSQLARGQ